MYKWGKIMFGLQNVECERILKSSILTFLLKMLFKDTVPILKISKLKFT